MIYNSGKMKKIIIGLIAISTFFGSCKKETKDVSKVYDAFASKLELKGDAIIAPPAGSTVYVDPGATFTDDDGSKVELTTPITLPDLTKPGFYSVTYRKTSIHGYIRTATRLVLVSNVDPAIDLSGDYLRPSNGVKFKITKLGPGLYKTNNVGGVASGATVGVDVYFGHTTGNTLEVPLQESGFGPVSCKNGSVTINAGKATISWVVLNQSYFLDNVRTFVQQ
jgi:hypothetical protein